MIKKLLNKEWNVDDYGPNNLLEDSKQEVTFGSENKPLQIDELDIPLEDLLTICHLTDQNDHDKVGNMDI